MHTHWLLLFLNQVNDFDHVHDHHLLFTFKYRWLIITEHQVLQEIQNDVINITHVSAVSAHFDLKVSCPGRRTDTGTVKLGFSTACTKGDLFAKLGAMPNVWMLSGVKGLKGPQASAAPANFTQEGGGWGLRPRQHPKNPIWQGGYSGLRPSWPPSRFLMRSSTVASVCSQKKKKSKQKKPQ